MITTKQLHDIKREVLVKTEKALLENALQCNLNYDFFSIIGETTDYELSPLLTDDQDFFKYQNEVLLFCKNELLKKYNITSIITYNFDGSRKEEIPVTGLKEAIEIYNNARKLGFPMPTLWNNGVRVMGF